MSTILFYAIFFWYCESFSWWSHLIGEVKISSFFFLQARYYTYFYDWPVKDYFWRFQYINKTIKLGCWVQSSVYSTRALFYIKCVAMKNRWIWSFDFERKSTIELEKRKELIDQCFTVVNTAFWSWNKNNSHIYSGSSILANITNDSEI